ncbi:hypothetical protein TRVA0_056S00870 [Trichomonascus vanleenenianus]|uniref:uncharacterized protein n=1 Tax=Trichomonascus vanleenenianus TaxID=2268995 RepID=UPI003ECB81A7
MESGNDRRIREVWETTQENLETAVGNAYSGGTRIYNRYIIPAQQSVFSCFACCCGGRPRRRGMRRRESVDIFFDMYDDDDAFGHDELERLIDADEDEELRGVEDDDGYLSDNESGEFPGVVAEGTMATSSSNLGAIKNYLMELLPGILPRKRRQVQYRPSGVRISRPRASTKSSTESTDTYRSRRDLFSESEAMEDAHVMDDNFGLVYKSDSASEHVITDAPQAAQMLPPHNSSRQPLTKRSAHDLSAMSKQPPPPQTPHDSASTDD